MLRTTGRPLLAALTSLVIVSCGSAATRGGAAAGGNLPTVAASATSVSAVTPTPEPTAPASAFARTPTPTPATADGPTVYVLPTRVMPSPAVEARPLQVANVAVAATALPQAVPPDHLGIPAIGLDADVVPLGWSVQQTDAGPVSVWDDLPAGQAAWLRSSAAPGQGSNVVLSGHHNMAGEVFRDLVNLKEGDLIILSAGGRDFVYVVALNVIVPERDAPEAQRQQNAAWMQPATCERLTLITCWPYETNTHRLIIVADPVQSTSLAMGQ